MSYALRLALAQVAEIVQGCTPLTDPTVRFRCKSGLEPGSHQPLETVGNQRSSQIILLDHSQPEDEDGGHRLECAIGIQTVYVLSGYEPGLAVLIDEDCEVKRRELINPANWGQPASKINGLRESARPVTARPANERQVRINTMTFTLCFGDC